MPFPEVPLGLTVVFLIVHCQRRPKRPPAISDFIWKIIEECWEGDPKKRPDLKTVLQLMKENDFGVEL